MNKTEYKSKSLLLPYLNQFLTGIKCTGFLTKVCNIDITCLTAADAIETLTAFSTVYPFTQVLAKVSNVLITCLTSTVTTCAVTANSTIEAFTHVHANIFNIDITSLAFCIRYRIFKFYNNRNDSADCDFSKIVRSTISNKIHFVNSHIASCYYKQS